MVLLAFDRAAVEEHHGPLHKNLMLRLLGSAEMFADPEGEAYIRELCFNFVKADNASMLSPRANKSLKPVGQV